MHEMICVIRNHLAMNGNNYTDNTTTKHFVQNQFKNEMKRRRDVFQTAWQRQLTKQIKSYIREFADSVVFSEPFTVVADSSSINIKPADCNP